MMRNANQYMGVGFYKAANGIYYWVQEFTEMNPNLLGSITFNANGGTINGKETYTITGTAGTYAWFYDAPSPSDIIDIPTPLSDGYTFSGWYITPTPLSSALPLKRDVYGKNGSIVYAKWTPNN